jgi:uncharacterized protein (TIGR02996 family)
VTHREALIRAVCETPDEDTPRLAFADLCDEEGDREQRGGFVRYQLAYEWHREHNDCPIHTAEEEYPRASDVWPYQEWPDSAYSLFDMDGDSLRPIFPQWRRGFVEEIDLPFAEFWPRAKKLFRAHPVRNVLAKGKTPHQDGPRTFEWLLHPGLDRCPDQQYALPVTLRHFLKGARKSQRTGKGRNTRTAHGVFRFAYDTAADALVDLNRACVRYGRWLCGLSPLPEPAEVQS